MAIDASLENAVRAVWRIPAPGPDNILQHPAFLELGRLCSERYGGGRMAFSLHNVLQSFGLPCGLGTRGDLALDPVVAATALDEALSAKTATRRFLCPLDLADDLPPLSFGPARVAKFERDELAALFDAPRLERLYPNLPLDIERLFQFQWLVVEEVVTLDPRFEARSAPILFTDLGRDLGEIDPHLGKFPAIVERTLFFLLLAAWEDWSTMLEVDWRGFRIPWVYTLSDDLCIRPSRPPDAETLSWEPRFVTDRSGEELEIERPLSYNLDEAAEPGLSLLTESAWQEFEDALGTPVFETPVMHFIVRAFLADGMDEVMAHMTAIEAALGVESDHKVGMRPKLNPHKDLRSTGRLVARIAALLQDVPAARGYGALFDVRSAFVHGRGRLQRISTQQKVEARRLARRIARALIDPRTAGATPREDVLGGLLDAGATLLANASP